MTARAIAATTITAPTAIANHRLSDAVSACTASAIRTFVSRRGGGVDAVDAVDATDAIDTDDSAAVESPSCASSCGPLAPRLITSPLFSGCAPTMRTPFTNVPFVLPLVEHRPAAVGLAQLGVARGDLEIRVRIEPQIVRWMAADRDHRLVEPLPRPGP